jgi:hypothetical protein
MVLGMAGFAVVEDALIKLASAQIPSGQILLTLGIFGGTLFGGLAWIRGHRALTPAAFHLGGRRAQCKRDAREPVCYVGALGLAPLVTTNGDLPSLAAGVDTWAPRCS